MAFNYTFAVLLSPSATKVLCVTGGTTFGLRTNSLMADYGNVTWHLCWHLCHTGVWEPALVFHEEAVLVLALLCLQLQRALP